jgi:hypothetical protein
MGRRTLTHSSRRTTQPWAWDVEYTHDPTRHVTGVGFIPILGLSPRVVRLFLSCLRLSLITQSYTAVRSQVVVRRSWARRQVV